MPQSPSDLGVLFQAAVDDPFAQYDLVILLATLWDGLTPAQQQESLSQAIQVIGRCRGAVDQDTAVQLFHRLRRLPQADLLDALRYDADALDDYQLEPGEEVYPEASPASPSWLGRYLWWARSGTAPLGFHAWAALSVLGTTAQRRVFFPGARRIWMNTYTMLGGMKATGKGQALDAALKVLHKVNDIVEAQDWDEDTKIQRRLNILPSDITGEALVSDLKGRVTAELGGAMEEDEDTGLVNVQLEGRQEQRADATGLIPLDEAATFFGEGAWNVAGKAALLTTLKESDRYVKRTKRSGLEELNNLALGMLACCAPAWMQSTIDTDIVGGGLMDRFVWVYREPCWERRMRWNIVNAPPRDPLIAEGLAQWLVDRILCLPTMLPTMLSPGARKALDDYSKHLVQAERRTYEKYGPDMEETTAGRAVWATTQVATLLALADGNHPRLVIESHHVEQARLWVDTENRSLAEFLKQANSKRDRKHEVRVLEFMERCGGCVLMGTINQQFRNSIGTAKEVRLVVESLVDQHLGEIRMLTSPRRREYGRIAGHKCRECEPGWEEGP